MVRPRAWSRCLCRDRRSTGRVDGSGPGSCLVLLAAPRGGKRANATQVLGLAASWQPPHVSNRYTTLDHPLSRVRPPYDAEANPGNVLLKAARQTHLAPRIRAGRPVQRAHAGQTRATAGQNPQSFLISASTAGTRARSLPSMSMTSTGPRTLLMIHTTSAACSSSTATSEWAVCQPASAALSNSSSWVVPARMPVAPSGVVCSVAADCPHDRAGRCLEHVAVGRDEDRVLGAAAGRLALRGHVDPVRERLDPAEQPGGGRERVAGQPAVEGDHADALAALARVVADPAARSSGSRTGTPAATEPRERTSFIAASPGAVQCAHAVATRSRQASGVERDVQRRRRAGHPGEVPVELVDRAVPGCVGAHPDPLEAAVAAGHARVVGADHRAWTDRRRRCPVRQPISAPRLQPTYHGGRERAPARAGRRA